MRQIRDLGFGALLYRPVAIRALCEADAGTADGFGVFLSLTLRQGPAALAPLCGYPPCLSSARGAQGYFLYDKDNATILYMVFTG